MPSVPTLSVTLSDVEEATAATLKSRIAEFKAGEIILTNETSRRAYYGEPGYDDGTNRRYYSVSYSVPTTGDAGLDDLVLKAFFMVLLDVFPEVDLVTAREQAAYLGDEDLATVLAAYAERKAEEARLNTRPRRVLRWFRERWIGVTMFSLWATFVVLYAYSVAVTYGR